MEEMRVGLASLLEEFATINWIIHDGGNEFLTYFPTEARLSFAASRISIPYKTTRQALGV